VQRQKELTQLKFNPVLWRQLSPIARATLAYIAHTTLDLYYDQITIAQTCIPCTHSE